MQVNGASSTIAGRAAYAVRQQTLEPVFGIIKSMLGFRQFSLRGLRKVTGEWNLVCLAWNVKRMAILRPKVLWHENCVCIYSESPVI